jgi:hypothetical protein
MIDYNEYIKSTIHTLNSAKVNIMDLSEEDRKTALDLEYEMNTSAENGATERFFQVLDEWKDIFIYGSEFNIAGPSPN